jgi:hypothetical protein
VEPEERHEDKISRRKALRKFGKFGLAATAAAGLADIVGRPSMAKASPDYICGGQTTIFLLDEGGCSIKCPSNYFCYHAYNQYTGAYGNHYCCYSPGADNPMCSCTRPAVASQ